jgi:hyperosmotically inducible periplasmic protein
MLRNIPMSDAAELPMDPSPRLPAVLAACSALLAGGAIVPSHASAFADPSSTSSDVSITAGVRRELVGMTRSATLAVDVQTVDGIVRLRGELPDDIDVQRAVAGARRVAGVREVDASQLATRADRRH